jgi:WD40 repeat protein
MPIGHIGSVLCIAAIPRQDGRVLLATGGADATIRLWDLMSNSPFGTPMIGHTDEVYAIAAVSVPHVR